MMVEVIIGSNYVVKDLKLHNFAEQWVAHALDVIFLFDEKKKFRRRKSALVDIEAITKKLREGFVGIKDEVEITHLIIADERAIIDALNYLIVHDTPIGSVNSFDRYGRVKKNDAQQEDRSFTIEFHKPS